MTNMSNLPRNDTGVLVVGAVPSHAHHEPGVRIVGRGDDPRWSIT